MKSRADILPYPRDDFATWQERWSRNPDDVATELTRRLALMPEQLRRAVFASVPDEDQIREQIADVDDADALPGVPFVVKDLFDMAGMLTRAGSTFLDEVRNVPSETSKLVENLQDNGMIFSGKTQLNEFAFGLSGENPHSGDCPHPRVPDALTGGSSSGSAWAVASGLVPFALGTDTAGSIRVPAAFCGIYGLRLVPNAWSRTGCFPLAPSFDTVGWFTSTAEDMRRATSILVAETRDDVGRGLFCAGAFEDSHPELRAAAERIAQYLELERDPELEKWSRGIILGCEPAFDVLRNQEAYEVHAQWLDLMKDRYSIEVWERINRGRHRDPSAISLAWDKREQARKLIQIVFDQYDFLVLPVTPVPTPRKSEVTEELRRRLLTLNIPASFCAQPVLTVPLQLADGRSGGLQFIFRDMPSTAVGPLMEVMEAYRV
ncbi:amidase [Ruficoccus sp. ZRK36]|uniref:amidase n=1 Tax=Ruficoccus sp. ZRK36 TaxID=2866311 RepID=UPI001C72C430|nr:amidase [Ruficoccus sp. ZRK36]QYY34377.1 amidase [Ruficoccus sp. ZRK36]